MISSILIKVDKTCDWIPVVSTVSNLLDLFLRSLPRYYLSETITRSHYWEYLERKRMDWPLFVPAVNIIYCWLGQLYAPLIQRLENIKQENQQIAQENQQLELEISELWETRFEKHFEQSQEIRGLFLEYLPEISLPSIDSFARVADATQKRMLQACWEQDINTVYSLLEKGLDPSFYHRGFTPLLIACRKGNPTLIHLLLKKGADRTQSTIFGMSPVVLACASGHLEAVKCFFPDKNLAQQRISLLRLDHPPISLSDLACYGGFSTISQYLIDQGAPLPNLFLVEKKFRRFFLLCDLFDNKHREIGEIRSLLFGASPAA